jgi:DNA-binding response OmpR family regulator
VTLSQLVLLEALASAWPSNSGLAQETHARERILDQVIVQLRKKLGDNGDDPKHLLTVNGVGYKPVR